MANNTLAVANLDYTGLRSSLVSFMQNYPQFMDYDFEGSNLSTLIDLLAYNTYINSFYTNMVMNEMFIDTAILRDSVVSHAKDLNYMPRSARSSQAFIDIQVFPNDNPPYVTIPAGAKFQGSDGNNVFTFLTTANTIISPVGGVYLQKNIPIYEGVQITETFIVNTAVPQRFILSNPNIDTTTLKVGVTNSLGANQQWTFYPDLFGVSTNTQAYFLQSTANNYEILFGDGVSGAQPINNARITASYIASNLDKPNGIQNFKSNQILDGYTIYTITPSVYSNGTIIAAAGGMAPESIQSVRFNAPRAYQTLQRAVTEEDYRNILFENFPEIRDVYVYGGDQLYPQQYGSVYIAVDITNAVGLYDNEKTKIQSFISTRAPLTITPVVVAADYTNIGFTVNINYNLNQSSLAASDIQGEVLRAIKTYNSTYLDKFNARFRYSQILSAIDNTDSAIVDNETTVYLIKEFLPVLNTDYSQSLSYQNSIVPGSITSTGFTYNGLACSLIDDSNGNIKLISTINGIQTPLVVLGTVDYTAGVVNLVNLNVSAFEGDYIAIYVTPKNHDFNASQNIILATDFNNVTINVTGIRV